MAESSMAQTSFIFLLFSFSIIILSDAAVSDIRDISIDCGSSDSHTDANRISWVGDTGFVATGSSYTFESTTMATSLTTLRYFPTGDTNCYTNIPVAIGGKVFVRTNFYYADYDGEFKPPKFDVVYDGKHRYTIRTTSTPGKYDSSEATFVSENGYTSVCFVRTFLNYHPFVSTIQVRSWSSGGGQSETPEGKNNNNLLLPFGISVPPIVALGLGGWGVWKYYIKPKRNQNVNVQVTVESKIEIGKTNAQR